MKGELDIDLSLSAKDAIYQFMAQAPSGHILSLVQFGKPGDIDAEWALGTYAAETIDTAEKKYESAGHALRYEVAGIELVVEPHFAKLLQGKVLDFYQGGFHVTERKNGI